MSFTMLPTPFVERMRFHMGSSWPALRNALVKGRAERGLRVHTGKIPLPDLLSQLSYPFDPVPWCSSAIYLPREEKPGYRLEHTLGLYYIQEPSALSAVEILQPCPGDWVLDLCASPGGKGTQIATKLSGKGLLVLNEINADRRTALFDNMERWGMTHAIVMGEHPERLAAHWPNTFDAILVDAPCSGEGMFRKYRERGIHCNPTHSKRCAGLQRQLLTSALTMLRPGGRLLYSTCTFNPMENESVVASILSSHPHVTLLPISLHANFSSGEPTWTTPPCPEVKHCARLWPHLLRGEGHFLALLTKEEPSSTTQRHRRHRWPRPSSTLWKCWTDWSRSVGIQPQIDDYTPVAKGGTLYAMPPDFPYVERLRYLRPGLLLGKQKGRTFVPSHALARVQSIRRGPSSFPTLALSPEETINIGRKGWIETVQPTGLWLLTSMGFPYAWGKVSHGRLRLLHPQPSLNTPFAQYGP